MRFFSGNGIKILKLPLRRNSIPNPIFPITGVDTENGLGSNTQCERVVRCKPVRNSAVDHLQNEAPRNDGDTGVVSAVGTPMLKSVKALVCKGRGRVLARQNDRTWICEFFLYL